jgi:hypothetical protein
MPALDIFSNNPAFSMMGMMSLVEKAPYVPSYLGGIPGLWTPRPVRTVTIPIEILGNKISIIQTSERGTPANRGDNGQKRQVIDVRTVRLADSDRIYADEIANVRAYGSTTELMQVQDEVSRRYAGPGGMLSRLELTREFHRLGAIDGLLKDANGDTIIDWYQALGLARPAVIEFDFAAASADGEGVIRQQCRALKREILKSLGDVVLPNMRVVVLCGDLFFDKLVDNPETRATYLGRPAASKLQDENLAYETFDYGDIRWVNYRGTEDGAVGVPADEFRAFPVAPGIFEEGLSPGEFLDAVNMPGMRQYPLVIPDKDRNMFVDLELYSYPLYICKRPEALRRGRIKAAG